MYPKIMSVRSLSRNLSARKEVTAARFHPPRHHSPISHTEMPVQSPPSDPTFNPPTFQPPMVPRPYAFPHTRTHPRSLSPRLPTTTTLSPITLTIITHHPRIPGRCLPLLLKTSSNHDTFVNDKFTPTVPLTNRLCCRRAGTGER